MSLRQIHSRESNDVIVERHFQGAAARLSDHVERTKDEGDALAAVQGVCVADLKVEVRADRVAGISEQTDDLTPSDSIAYFYANAAGLKMRVEGVAIPT